jgi:hypothetical protein
MLTFQSYVTTPSEELSLSKPNSKEFTEKDLSFVIRMMFMPLLGSK